MKKIQFSLVLIFVLSLFGCKGTVDFNLEEPSVKMVNLTVGAQNAREVVFNLDENLRFELEIRDEHENLYQEFRKNDAEIPTYEEFYDYYKDVMKFGMGRDQGYNPEGSGNDGAISSSYQPTEEELEENIKRMYESMLSYYEEIEYYRSPYFETTIPEGTYTFILKGLGTEDFNKDVVLLEGKTTQKIEGNEFTIPITLEYVENSLKTGSIKYELQFDTQYPITSTYQVKYTSLDEYKEKGSDAQWHTENLTTKVISNEYNYCINTEISNLAPAKYFVQYEFTFKGIEIDGTEKEYKSYLSKIFEVKKGFVSSYLEYCYSKEDVNGDWKVPVYEFRILKFDLNGGETTSSEWNEIGENVYYIKKVATSYSTNIPVPTKVNYIFKGWSDSPESSDLSKDFSYNYYYPDNTISYCYYQPVSFENKTYYAIWVETTTTDPTSEDYVTISGTWPLVNFPDNVLNDCQWYENFEILIKDGSGSVFKEIIPEYNYDYFYYAFGKDGSGTPSLVLNYKLPKTSLFYDVSECTMDIVVYLCKNYPYKRIKVENEIINRPLTNGVMSVDREVNYTRFASEFAEEQKITVYWDTNYGTWNASNAPETDENGMIIYDCILSENCYLNPTREGYEFIGWDTSPVLDPSIIELDVQDKFTYIKINGNYDSINNEFLFCAKWKRTGATVVTINDDFITISSQNKASSINIIWTFMEFSNGDIKAISDNVEYYISAIAVDSTGNTQILEIPSECCIAGTVKQANNTTFEAVVLDGFVIDKSLYKSVDIQLIFNKKGTDYITEIISQELGDSFTYLTANKEVDSSIQEALFY